MFNYTSIVLRGKVVILHMRDLGLAGCIVYLGVLSDNLDHLSRHMDWPHAPFCLEYSTSHLEYYTAVN